MMVVSILATGFLIGMNHAMEADHVAAVSSLVSRKKGVGNIARHGAFWGLGHALMLTLIGGTAILMQTSLSDQVAAGLEFAVGVMLVGLGIHVLWRLHQDRVHFHAHAHHGGNVHIHAHSHRDDPLPHEASHHTHKHPEGLPWRTLLVGIMHGMAGSAALIVLTAATLHSPLLGLVYIVVFGIGSVLGMALLSLVIALPITYAARSVAWLHRGIQVVIGGATICLGLSVMYATGFQIWTT
jgi:cytochrome c biogenesis protein CcdA